MEKTVTQQTLLNEACDKFTELEEMVRSHRKDDCLPLLGAIDMFELASALRDVVLEMQRLDLIPDTAPSISEIEYNFIREASNARPIR